MTRTANARLAGFAYLFYIAVAFPAMLLDNRALSGRDIAEQLSSVARHATDMRVVVILELLSAASALMLAVGLYGITRDEDHELAVLALVCRAGEGVLNALPLTTLGLLWLATAAGPDAPDSASAHAVGLVLLKVGGWKAIVTATLFAVGSTVFSYLLLRGRMIPVPLARLGVGASALLVVGLPLRLAGFVHGPMTSLMWLPMLAFEVPLALWLLTRGVAAPTRAQAA
jgi:hypothetical protein